MCAGYRVGAQVRGSGSSPKVFGVRPHPPSHREGRAWGTPRVGRGGCGGRGRRAVTDMYIAVRLSDLLHFVTGGALGDC